ncbi:MAG: aminoacetone oxidase family FAD-binding enzyme [Lachnospiraceae bacterium]|nr:aminoacetone oxidase family FAD-binding enzyme [Lachnospiraceae bacterium]
MRRCEIVIVGAGAAGVVAAITAARRGRQVLLVDGNDRIGRKLLSTGNGRCNFLNENQTLDAFRSDSMAVVSDILGHFPISEILSFFEEIGITATCRKGYYYPYTRAAKDVRDCLEMEIRRLGIEVLGGWRIESIERVTGEDGFRLQGKREEEDFEMECARLVLATGGLAFPASGSDGFGLQMANRFGHRIVPLSPALTRLCCAEPFFRKCKGIRLTAEVRLYVDGLFAAKDRGEVQLAADGISGIPVFNVSRFATRALLQKGKEPVEAGMGFRSHGQPQDMQGESSGRVEAGLDFLPYWDSQELAALLSKRFYTFGWGKSICEALRGLLPPALIEVVLRKAKVDPSIEACTIRTSAMKRLAELLQDFRVQVTGFGDYAKAQTTAGGVSLEEIDPATMESTLVERLYFCGELLDVDGLCGGYNLQWAWVSGFVCGSAL